MPGASVRVNGALVSAGTEALAIEERDVEGTASLASGGCERLGGVLDQDYRVLFGSRHFFRVDCGRIPPPGTYVRADT